MYQRQIRPLISSRKSAAQSSALRSHFSGLEPGRICSAFLQLFAKAAVCGAVLVVAGCGGLTYTSSGTSVPALTQVSCGAQSLTGAQTKPCTVSLSAAALKPTTVSLKSSNSALQLPSTVIVGTGASSASFNAVSSAVATATSVTISGVAGGVIKTAVITLYPETISLSGISCVSQNVTGPITESCTVYLNNAASAATPVTLQSSSSSVQVPSTVTVATGATSAGFSANVSAVATTQSVTLTATGGGVSQTAVLQVQGSGNQSSVQHQVRLSWDAPAASTSPVVGYRVYRADSGTSGYSALSSSLSGQTNYTDTTVQSGSTYDYVVTSVDGGGLESAYSNPTTVTIP